MGGPGDLGSYAEDEAAMQGGKGGMQAGIAVAVVAVIGLVALVLGAEDESRVYGDLGKKINGIKMAKFDKFWGCALQGVNLKDIKSNGDVATQVGGRASERGASYAVHVREKCLPMLEDVKPELDVLIVEDPDLAADVAGMGTATGDLRSGWSGFIAYLDDPELEYDEARAKDHIKKISRAWYDFKQAHRKANEKLKVKLDS